jgi:septum formation protein
MIGTKEPDMSIIEHPAQPLVLASKSPRRAEILQAMGFSFDTAAPGIENEEEYIDPGHLETSLQELALAKAHTVAARFPESLILSGDTVVVCDERVLGKPASPGEAASMIALLSGRSHRVLTAVALVCARQEFSKTSLAETRVTFRSVSEREIERYLENDDYKDKAGAYAIQGRAMIFVDSIEGCFYNVVGLPVSRTLELFAAYRHRKDILHARDS